MSKSKATLAKEAAEAEAARSELARAREVTTGGLEGQPIAEAIVEPTPRPFEEARLKGEPTPEQVLEVGSFGAGATLDDPSPIAGKAYTDGPAAGDRQPSETS